MKISISYAICVCNESRDLYSLIAFLKKVIDKEDEINVLVDTAHVTPQVRKVLEHFKDDISTCERAFDGKFAEHRNFHFRQCAGDYIFTIDPDEMPQELLIETLKETLKNSQPDLVWVPRINMSPGFTKEWLKHYGFRANELGWINWPDYQGRITRNTSAIKWDNELHEKIIGADKQVQVQPKPELALWHIKSVEKQDNRWDENFNYACPKNDNLYDQLM
jgi:hypothetical protein